MIYMYKTAVIGNYEGVCGFAAAGAEVFGADNAAEAEQVLRRLIKEQYAIIFIYENYIEKMPRLFEKYKKSPLPAIVPIPSAGGSTGFAARELQKCVKRAVGTDIT